MPALRRRVASRRSALRAASSIVLAAAVVLAIGAGPGREPRVHFVTGHNCLACHNSLTTPAGEDASIGFDWRASIMANSSRDPYWQGSVRREVLEHPTAQATIEDECATCHMPMARYEARSSGGRGAVFAHLPQHRGTDPTDSLAADGVSCTLCHQIQPTRLGDSSSFDGGFVVDSSRGDPERPVFGPYRVDRGHTTIMHSATGFVPTEGAQIRESELCATCHTLFTTTLGPAGEPIGRLPEQMPFLEWRHSAYRNEQSCQQCHMPAVSGRDDSVPITAVLGQPRPGVRRHVFVGGNFFVLGMLNRYRSELAVEALPQELDAVASRTRELLSQAARVAVKPRQSARGRLAADIVVTNLNGHKLPTAFPSRRAWLHVTVRDPTGSVVFESGAITPAGRIVGNDNDDDRTRYEPHYREITRPDQVELYESILVDPKGAVTTGLLSGVRYIKDNRVLPRGFDKGTASPDIAVIGDAASDPAFVGGTDRVRYTIDVSRSQGPFRVEAELWYQPIGFRWAHNLTLQPAPETDRFVAYYDAMAAASGIVLARDSAVVR